MEYSTPKKEVLYLSFQKKLEDDTENEAYSPFCRLGIVEVAEASYVIDMEDFEDIVHSKCSLDIRTVGVHELSGGTKRAVTLKHARKEE